MKVMTFNVLCHGCEGHDWFDRQDDVIATVRKYMPDIFGLQEAHLDWMKVFWKNMPEYDYVGVGRDDGKEDGEFSPVFYKKEKFDFIEIMCCPGGCVNGGGQPLQPSYVSNFTDLKAKRSEALYKEDEGLPHRKSHQSPLIKKLYDEFLEKPGSETAHKVLHTHYNKVDKPIR